MIIMGYDVEKVGENYIFTGPKGGIKQLIRYPQFNCLLYAVDKHFNTSHIKGNCTWTDCNGSLRPYYEGLTKL